MRWVKVMGLPPAPGIVFETRMSGPASSEMPLARARASSRFITPEAWNVMGALTAPDTLMGRLRDSTTETVTMGSTMISSFANSVATAVSTSEGSRPSTAMRALTMGRRMAPSEATRTVRVSSGESYTEMPTRSSTPIFWTGRLEVESRGRAD